MMRTPYRPWGRLPWVVKHSRKQEWSFLGCLGTEQRSLTAWTQLSKFGKPYVERFIRIVDKPSLHSILEQTRLKERLTEFIASGGNESEIIDLPLFSLHNEIVEAADDFIDQSNGSIALDITSLPKRYFFPLVKRCLASDKVNDFMVTYSLPERYPRENLAENFNDWAHLPLFAGSYSSAPSEMLVIGVGFQALGLHEHLKGEQGRPIKLLIPFPAAPSAFMRSWELSRQLRRYGSADVFEVFRADSRDPSDTFDRLLSLSNSGNKRISLAPFGPKPMSLGMCLFATLANCEVFYTQPSSYHPDYSIGISQSNGTPDVFAYTLRQNGINVYNLG